MLVALSGQLLAADVPPLFKYLPQTLSEVDRRATATLYARTCASCHGMDGGGVNNGLALYNAKVPQISAGVIHFGAVEPVDKPIIMPAYGALSILSPTEIGPACRVHQELPAAVALRGARSALVSVLI